MSTSAVSPSAAVLRPVAEDGFLRDVLHGLGLPRKALPCKYFYDERGSQLFDQICELEEYYPTRCELEILRRHAGAIAEVAGRGCVLIEYGSGSSLKTRLLLDHLGEPAAYVPVDISGEHLASSAARLARRYRTLRVLPVCADFTRAFELPAAARGGRRVVYFSGSTIGNFPPAEAVPLLGGMASLCGPGGGLLLAVDSKKDVVVLERAYNDRLGVTAAFNLNLLARCNRELGADFRLDRFRHHALYDERHGRIEMHLISLEAQSVHVGGHTSFLAAGETILTEYSYKYSPEDFRALAGQAGLRVERVWTDEKGWFSVQWLGAA
jgi:dimethylhistidine N-methyltransferase